jgi:hypothetical protein
MFTPPHKRSKINKCINTPSNITYDDKYRYIVNCLRNPSEYLNIKKAVSSFLYSRGENNGKPIDRRKTLELCSNKKLENMFIENPGSFNFTEDEVCCSICGKRINEGNKYEIDHLIPSTFFFVLFAKYYHGCRSHPHITKQKKGHQMCDEFIEEREECGSFVTKLISIVHKGCNQAKGDAMFFVIDIKGDPHLPESSWSLAPNQPIIDDFIVRYINKLYPINRYTGIGYMNADSFAEHAHMLTDGINKETMEKLMTTRLNTFVQHVCASYNGGNMGHIFDNLFLLDNVPLTLVNKTTEIDITHYLDEIREKYDIDYILLQGILIDKTVTTQKMSNRLPRNTHFASVPSFFIQSNVSNPSFEQVCELIDDAIEKQHVENPPTKLGAIVRKKTKRIRKIRRRPTKVNKTRNKRT